MTRVEEQYQRATRSLAGGVSSSTRLNRAVGHAMLFDRADGCRLWDLDGREHIDLCCSHGATLLGHGHPAVRAAIDAALSRGAACSYENETHAELAELLCETVPCLERVRFTGSGTEATLHVLRLARACTGRSRIVKFEGNFHGYHDQVMFAIGHPADRLGTLHPGSSGMPPGLADHLVLVPYNRPDLLEDAFEKHGHEIAAVIGEPVYYNAGCILPTREFLDAMRSLTLKHGALLVFDEVLSAFRMCPGGAQEHLQVTPDLCTLGKAVGGGQPLSVFGGRADLMDRLMPTGDCQHSGTYNGHPVAVAAALAAVKEYRKPGFYEHLAAVGQRLLDGLNASFRKHGIDALAQGLGARFGVWFGLPSAPRDYAEAVRHQRPLMLRFIKEAIGQGAYFH
ncbi:MAG: aminotransferase class III-fold pyridoxal phosphate-dependent enzyme, partial [Gemmataceae bacterium]|nr:aminotransferase class III-fold pyridoxal phosphate-dependent enzyme [Gemmataceae bacterium]